MIIVVMGVSGVGKSTVGVLLAAQLGMDFIEADEFHGPGSIEKMRSGIPLTEADRLPWLRSLAEMITERQHRGTSTVLACSALRARHRDILGGRGEGVTYVFLHDDPARIRQRISSREGHFMPPSLLDDQLATLEEPTEAIRVSTSASPRRIVQTIRRRLVDLDGVRPRILVTGGTGHLGAALVHELVRGGHSPDPIRVAYLPGTTTAAVDGLEGVDLHPANLLDPVEVRGALEGVTHVYHVAGNTSFHPGRRELQWRVNVEATRNVCEAALASDSFVRLVHTSTVNVLGVPDPIGSLGDEETLPWAGAGRVHSFASPGEALALADAVHTGTAPGGWWRQLKVGYMDSKLAADLLVERYVQDRGLPAVRVLPGTAFGPYDRLVGNGLYLLKLRASEIPAVTPETGLPCAHVRDVARGHLLAMERGGVGERYVISGREEDNLYLSEMLRVMADVLREKEPGRIVRLPRWRVPTQLAWVGGALSEAAAALSRRAPLLTRAAVLAGSFPSFYTSAKAREELGYRPKETFRQAVADLYDDWAACGMLDAKERAVDS